MKAACRTSARKFLIDLSRSSIPFTCTKVFDQDRRSSWRSDRYERLDHNRSHRFVPGDSPSVLFPFDSVLSR
jgi:hypothetical protein